MQIPSHSRSRPNAQSNKEFANAQGVAKRTAPIVQRTEVDQAASLNLYLSLIKHAIMVPTNAPAAPREMIYSFSASVTRQLFNEEPTRHGHQK